MPNDNDVEIEDSIPTSSDSEIEIEEVEGSLQDKLKNLKKKFAQSEKEKLEYLTGWQRSKADFVNASRRMEEEKSRAIKFASEGLIENIVPVLDSFDSALQNKEGGAWRDGMERIREQLIQTLRGDGLELINEVGVPVDPRLHEPIRMTGSSAEHSPNTVTEVLQKGYRLGDKVIRPAKVVVAE